MQWWAIVVSIGVIAGIAQDLLIPIFSSPKEDSKQVIYNNDVNNIDSSNSIINNVQTTNQSTLNIDSSKTIYNIFNEFHEDYLFDLVAKDYSQHSYLDVYWQDRIYWKYDFAIYPDNIFTINGGKTTLEAIDLRLINVYEAETDYYFSVVGKGGGGPNLEIFDVPIPINSNDLSIPIFKLGNEKNLTQYIGTDSIATEIHLNDKKYNEFRLIFNNTSGDSLLAFEYYIQIKWSYYDKEKMIRKTNINKSKKYLYSFAPKKPFSDLYFKHNPKTAHFYLNDNMYSKAYYPDYKIDSYNDFRLENFLWFALPRPKNGYFNPLKEKSLIPIINIRDGNSWINYDSLNSEILKNNFIVFDDSILFINDQKDIKNLNYSGFQSSETYITEIIYGKEEIKKRLYKKYGR